MIMINPKPSYKHIRQLKENNIKGFKNSISLVNWDFVNQDNDQEIAYKKFLHKNIELFNIHCPKKTIKISSRKTPCKPWVTSGFLESIRTKDKSYKKYVTKPTSENKIKHTKFRNLLNNLLRTNKYNIKQTWKTLNSLLGRNKQTKLPDFF